MRFEQLRATILLPPEGSSALQSSHLTIQSVGATGGVYKRQGRNHRSLMNYDY